MAPPHITLIIGPMFSGKSTYLLSFERRFLLTPNKILVIKHVFDTVRYSATHVATHTGETSQTQSLNVSKLSEIPQAVLEASDVILIDEGQFFDDLSEWVTFIGTRSNKPRHIVIAGLSGDYKQQNFKSIASVISQVDTIVHLKSTCSVCGVDAPFTTRLDGDKNTADQTLVGSSDFYQPRCRKHITLT